MKNNELKAGLEIHQQLAVNKLFCSCSSCLSEKVVGQVYRRLRASASELGEIDEAARQQSEKGTIYRYEITDNSCLVELDEEPPHPPGDEAVKIALEVAELLHSNVVDEIHFMRKIVVDGSNTTGFQRTGLIALGGYVDVDGKRIGIQSICLEEDACRKISENEKETVYRLDRLGIPLLEIATEAEMLTPQQLRSLARNIGMLLRATGKVRRGIGTIREDVNISIPGGARVEIKGVQELDMLPEIAVREAERQEMLIECARRLQERNASVSEWVDVTEMFSSTASSVLKKGLERGWRVGACLLRGFRGTLSAERKMIGTEIAQRLRVRGIRGIIHSDELPGYGLTEGDAASVLSRLGGGEMDAFVLCTAPANALPGAFSIVRQRALQAIQGVPEETRDAMPDGTTVYSRPLPGRARMYPETDVLPVIVSEELLREIRSSLPETFEVQAARITTRYGIHRQQSVQIAEEGLGRMFEELAGRYGNAPVLARLLLNLIPEAERETKRELQDYSIVADIMRSLAEGAFAKEAIGDILRCVLEGGDAGECIRRYSRGGVAMDDILAAVREIVVKHGDLVRSKGMASLGPLMGIAMKELRGKVDGKELSDMLSEEIAKIVE